MNRKVTEAIDYIVSLQKNGKIKIEDELKMMVLIHIIKENEATELLKKKIEESLCQNT